VLVALAAVGPAAAVIVLVEVLAYQQLENYVLSPRLSQKTMELNAGVAFAAAMAGGAVGAFGNPPPARISTAQEPGIVVCRAR
jgi:predicted PurR-regulated permease PerM